MEKTFLIINALVWEQSWNKRTHKMEQLCSCSSIFEGKLPWKLLVEQWCISHQYLWYSFQFIFTIHLCDQILKKKTSSQFRQFLSQENNSRQLIILWRHARGHACNTACQRVYLLKARAIIASLRKPYKKGPFFYKELSVGN